VDGARQQFLAPVRLQIKLLRALQENMIRPVGSADGIPVNVRVMISARQSSPASTKPEIFSAF